MQTRHSLDPLQPKNWQLEASTRDIEGYLYYCTLCDEALVCSRQILDPQKIQLAFHDSCPGCGFELERIIGCRPTSLPSGRRLLTHLSCENPQILSEHKRSTDDHNLKTRAFPSSTQPDLTTGIDSIDKILALKKGRMVFLNGEPSHALSLLICARTIAPPPEGFNGNVVFLDAGNVYDSYTISQHAVKLGLDNEGISERFHLSRAFTHHQVHNLIVDKLVTSLEAYSASVAVISDITALFCDPDVRDKKESLDVFRKSIRFLAETAESQNKLVIVTNMKQRSKRMEEALSAVAHVSANLTEKASSTQIIVTLRPFASDTQNETKIDCQTLTKYLP